MPWSAADATRHTKAASTQVLRELWAKVANNRLKAGASEGSAIREANEAVTRAKAHRHLRII